MIADLKPYAEYRKSGLPWLGQVPGHWEVKKLREVARVVNGFPFDSRRFSLSHGYPLIRIRDLDKNRTAANYSGKFVEAAKVLPGDLLIGMDGDFNVGTWRGGEPALLNQRMCRVEATTPDATHFLRYVLPRTLLEINELTYATTVKHLSSGQVERIQFGSPPPAEQAAIVRFLDWANGRLERAIRAKRKVIVLLGEQKQAIIHRAVTRGLDPSVPLKPSGIPWLGDIPQHWETPLNQRVFREEIRDHGDVPETQLSLSQRDGLIATKDMQERSLQTATYDNWKVTLPGDLVLNRFKAHLGVFFAATLRGIVSFHYGVFAPKRELCSKYFELLFHTAPYRTIYAGRSNGMTVGLQNLSNQNFYNVRCVLPPLAEQVAIVDETERETRTLNTATSRLEREIELLREYRTRLVADVVTGKLDVREAALHLPDEALPATVEDDADLNSDSDAIDEEADV